MRFVAGKKRKMKNLTETDLKNLAALPADKWFDAIDVWPAVKRTSYSLDRLIQAGYVEKQIGDGPFYHPRYRKIKETSGSHAA